MTNGLEETLWIQNCFTQLKNWPCATSYAWEMGWVNIWIQVSIHNQRSLVGFCTAKTDLHQLCVDTRCYLEDLPRVKDDRDGWRERERERERERNLVQSAWLDEDDDDILLLFWFFCLFFFSKYILSNLSVCEDLLSWLLHKKVCSDDHYTKMFSQLTITKKKVFSADYYTKKFAHLIIKQNVLLSWSLRKTFAQLSITQNVLLTWPWQKNQNGIFSLFVVFFKIRESLNKFPDFFYGHFYS